MSHKEKIIMVLRNNFINQKRGYTGLLSIPELADQILQVMSEQEESKKIKNLPPIQNVEEMPRDWRIWQELKNNRWAIIKLIDALNNLYQKNLTNK